MSVKRPLAPMRNRSGCIHVEAELLLHQDEPGERVLGRAQAARRLEADVDAGALAIIAQRPHHHQAHRQAWR